MASQALLLPADIERAAVTDHRGLLPLPRPRWRRRPAVTSVALGAVIVGLLVVLVIVVSAAEFGRGAGSLRRARELGGVAVHLRWQYLAIVLVLAGLHYLATSVSARAAAGLRVPIREALLVQLAAAAANRLTPAGLGGSAINARFFTRRGLTASAAAGAVATLSVLGALADLVVLVAIVIVGGLFGLGGGPGALKSLLSRVDALAALAYSPWFWASLLLGCAFIVVAISRYKRVMARYCGQFWTPLLGLIRRPSALLTLMVASGLTTLVLGFAFVASTAMVPGPRPSVELGALIVAFMVGSAAGSAVPVPAGVGTTEAALVGVLVTSNVPVAHAVQVVLMFRLLTFWLPAGVGLVALRALHRRGAL
jgi:uncharacterized membrane protein YbhN (UPF0104 family)